MNKLTPTVAVLACVSLLEGRQLERSCGTYNNNWREELQLHRQSQAAQRGRLSSKSKQAIKLLQDVGNIAHLEDTDGVVARRNPFNLNEKAIRFVLSGTGQSYRVEPSAAAYNPTSATSGTALPLEDDDSREVSLPFPFPYFGGQYRSVFVNSDGNLTFGKPDSEITDRSLGRFLAGAPRIAAQFNDLDPSVSTNGVRVRNEPNRVIISWAGVPEYRDSGRGPQQTFQVRLYSDGAIELAYQSGTPAEAVVGITPGGLKGDPSLVTLATPTPREYPSSIAERFSDTESIDIFSAAQKFYRNHEDAYDYLVIYNTLSIDAGATAVAYEVTVRNNRTGYGDVPAEAGEQAGSKKRLQAILNMGPLSQYPRDPNAKVPARVSVGDTPLSTLAHEMGHLFLAYASVEDESGEFPMLGYQSAHWDFKFNSEASLLEGNRIKDNGAGASPRFQTTGAVEGYSALDQYLMGLRAPAEVPDTFYVTDARGAVTSGLPRTGVTFDGRRVNVSVQDVIAATGRRTPDHTVSQRSFRLGFMIVTAEGQDPTADQLAQVEAYRAGIEAYFSKAAGERASATAFLRKSVSVSGFPAFGVLTNGSAPVAVSLERPAEAALTLSVRSRSGLLRTPGSVTIPAGASEVQFTVNGLSEGVDDLIVEPASSQFDVVIAKVQVQRANALKLKVLSDASPVRVRVTDVNELPYPGVAIEAKASGGGSLDRASGATGFDGSAEFQWTQSTQANNTLSVTVAGGPTTTITAGAAPAFAVASVVNAASYTAGLTPNALATVFGLNLGGQNAQVLLNGRPAQILFANGGQVNFATPADLAEGTAEVVVRAGNATSTMVRIPVRSVQPGLFFDAASGFGAITLAGSGSLTQEQRPTAGEYISIFATGLGAVRPTESGLSETVVRPEVWIGGVQAEVTYSGLAPGFVGLYQVNARVPAGTAAGVSTVAVSAAGLRSNEVRIRVR